ncbi:hypothetical protein [Paenibacillus monticola]|uniref:Uncharacterized protein n=1 Tax=Paenibacillus monticola TaxID=2666075 RepID=A0A7X2HBV3_9BACL|nr:hypothetical protein [Paenibacillus monticola]MRN57192.1 hypothetical protein [Paenibacillus monticola]
MESNTKGAATFYQYKLIKKINITNTFMRIYLTLLPISIVVETLFVSWWSIFFLIIAAPIVVWIQYVISRSVLLITGHPIIKRWRTSFQLPWLGYMPDQYISYRLFRKVQLHNFWIGLCIATFFIVWSPPAFTVSLVVCHLWLLLPRIFILIRLRREDSEGMLKFSTTDVSYYSQ